MFPAGAVVPDRCGNSIAAINRVIIYDHDRQVSEPKLLPDKVPMKSVNHLETVINAPHYNRLSVSVRLD
jgi:hypothetical protein